MQTMISLKVPVDWPDRLCAVANDLQTNRSTWMRGVISRALDRAERAGRKRPEKGTET